MIIDAHAHLIRGITGTIGKGEIFDRRNGEVEWLDGTVARIIPENLYDNGFTTETLIQEMDRAGVEKALIMQAYYYGVNNLYAYQAVRSYPDRLRATGSFDPYAVEQEQIMRRLSEDFGFCTFKFEISEGFGLTGIHPEFRINGAVMQPVYRYAARKEITIIYDLGNRGTRGFQLKELVETARTYPEISFVVCHLLAPTAKEQIDVWKKDMELFAACENIYFDISGLPWNVREEYPNRKGAEFARMACDMAGAERLIWGSDVPCVLTLMDYEKQYQFLQKSGRFTDRELNWILGGTAEKVYWKKQEK